jgi:ABC-type antimicrobial peptide transport system permease subunit
VARPRFSLLLLNIFAAAAIALAALGIYGLMAFVVSRRSHELAIRLALGATPGVLARLVVIRGLALTGAGLVLGISGSLLTNRYLAGMLYGISALEPRVYALAATVLALSALAASAVPARRVLHTDPLTALRCDP